MRLITCIYLFNIYPIHQLFIQSSNQSIILLIIIIMTGQRDTKFYSELKQLNGDLIDYLKLCHEKSPYFDFSPTIKDYLKQFADLEKQYSCDKQPMQPFLFGSPLNPNPTSFFSFTLPPKKDEENTANNSIINNTTTTTTTNNSTFSSNNNNNNLNKDTDTNKDNDEDDDVPPEPKIDKYEEPNAKHSAKCKLYEKGKGVGSEVNVNLLGIGMLYVKGLDTPNKLQVIVRQEPDLRRVLLNDVISSNIPVKLLPKAVQITVPGQGGEIKYYIIKVKDESEASVLYEMLNLAGKS